MAEIAEEGGGGHGKKGKKRAKKSSARIDMTPMVDLAFLLLTFFVLTSTFSKPKTMEINYPAKPEPNDNIKPPEVKNGLTLILTKDNRIFYYKGEFILPNDPKGRPATQLEETDFSTNGLHKILTELNKSAIEEIKQLEEKAKRKEIPDSTFKRLVMEAKGKKEALTVLIKTDDQATYKNFVDVVDELNLSMVGKYVTVDMMPQEYELLKQKLGQ
ncbi:MAG TPA: biopolymer transporter ExbD [Bacteroidia bacterium]|nr:biopolymer transporter ExbD [Bacteroidia bacterium]